MGAYDKRRGESEEAYLERLMIIDCQSAQVQAERERIDSLSYYRLLADIDAMKNTDDLKAILRKFAEKLGVD